MSADMVDGRYSWVVLTATSLAFFFYGAITYALGLMHVEFLDRFHAGHSKTAWVGALFAANSSLAGPLASVLLRRFSCRLAMIVSGLLKCLGFFLTGFATNIDQCIITFGIVAGIGGGIEATVGWTVLGYNFRKYLTVASGLAGMSLGFGTLIMPPVMRYLMVTYGYTGSFICIAGMGLQNLVAGALYRPSRLEQKSKVHMNSSKNRKSSKRSVVVFNALKDFFSVCSSIPILLMSFSLFFHAFGIFLVYTFLPSYCLDLGSSSSQTAFVVSASGLGSITGRGLLGLAATSGDIDVLTSYFSCIGIFGMVAAFFPLFSHAFSGQVVFALVLGLFPGAIYSILGELLVQLVGVGNHSHGYGSVFFLFGIGALLGPIFTAFWADSGGNLGHAFIIAGFCNLAASGLAMAVPSFKTIQEVQSSSKTEDRTIEVPLSVEMSSLMDTTG